MQAKLRSLQNYAAKQKADNSDFNWTLWLFLILVGLLLHSGIWFTHTAHMPVKINSAPQTALLSNDPVFTVKVTKNSANHFMATYLLYYLLDSKIKYAVTLDSNTAALSGSFKFLGLAVKFQLNLHPLVLLNGHVLLKAKLLLIGDLPVPISFVHSYIGNSYKIPKWVSLDSKAGTVVLKYSQFKLQNGHTLKANKLDHTKQHLTFAVYLPHTQTHLTNCYYNNTKNYGYFCRRLLLDTGTAFRGATRDFTCGFRLYRWHCCQSYLYSGFFDYHGSHDCRHYHVTCG